MKKRLTGALLLLMAANASFAQLSLADKMTLRRELTEQKSVMQSIHKNKTADSQRLPAFTTALVKISEGFTADDLRSSGAVVAGVRGNIAMVCVPADSAERFARLNAVDKMELSRERRVRMDEARPAAGISKIHGGIDMDRPYTADGVLVGIVDQGMDPNHINFRNSDGSSRIGLLTHFYTDRSSADGYTGKAYRGEEIKEFTTDTHDTFHGTHTMGILAGGYRGPVTAAVSRSLTVADLRELDSNPFYGVAYGAEIAASCGDLQDMFIALGIDQILSYSEYTGKPAVISLSLGSNVGSHNPHTLMSQFLEQCSEDAIIVLSAGNEGDIPLAITKQLTADDTRVQSFILPTYQNNVRYGQVYFYSPEEFSLQAVIYNKKRGKVAYRMPVKEGQGAGEPQYYCSSDFAEYDTDIVASQFSTAFSGYVGVGWDTEPYTDEYMCLMDYYTVNNEVTNLAGDYILGFMIEGKPGQRIECYCDGIYTALSNYGEDGWDDGSTDGTISDMACGNGVLVVGSYNTRDEYPALDGGMYGYQGTFSPGTITPFSSYGTLADGRVLPHVCAPGAVVISSSSTFYTEDKENRVDNDALNAMVEEWDRNNYWCPAMGTSMATPLVAGSIALWLEADPSLTIEEVKEIITATSVRDDEVLKGNPVQWGAGKFDAYAGLKEVVRRSMGITSPAGDDSRLITQRIGDSVTFALPGDKGICVEIYNMQGSSVARHVSSTDEVAADISALSPGVYVAVVNGRFSVKLAK